MPKAEGARLLDLARKGDVKLLVKAAEDLAAKDPSFAPLVAGLSELADNFKMKQMRQMIEEHTDPTV